MSNVTLSIGGRSYNIACADGEEAHVARLGRLIDEKALASGAVGQTESRMLLFAALMLADEYDELQARSIPAVASDKLAPHLVQLAERIENLADLLESGALNA